MPEILIKLDLIDMEIQMLKNMQCRWSNNIIMIPEITTTGDMSDKMRSVINHYNQLYCMMNELTSTTISFMNSIKEKYTDLNIETSKIVGMTNIAHAIK